MSTAQDTKDRVAKQGDKPVTHENVLEQLNELAQKSQSPLRTEGNWNNPVPAAERTAANTSPAATGQLSSAAGAIQAARTALQLQVDSDKRLMSDPRYERDQRIYELGQAGKLGKVPPTEAEKAAAAMRSGLDPKVIEMIPSTPEEQVADDMKRLDQAEKLSAPVKPGETDGQPQNNFDKAKKAGVNTGDRTPKDNEAKNFDTGKDNPNVLK